MPRPRWWLTAGVILVLASGVFGWFGCYAPYRAHWEWYRRVDADLRLLDGKRPTEVAPERWNCMVLWTSNLHGNCGAPGSMFDQDSATQQPWRERFASELERRLAGPVTLADIDWIWDEYVAHTRLGQKYSDSYRPTRADVCPP